MPNFKHWYGRQRGAAATEKLLVILFASILVGGAIMVFGPTLAKKYTFAAKMLNMEPAPARTLADGPVRVDEGTNPIWYVVFTFGVVAFFAVFIAPLLFPRARRTRALIIIDLVERFPILTPLVDADMMADERLNELRGLAQEVNELERHKAGALQIQPHDYGKMALPSEQTVDASFSEMPNLDAILAGEAPKKAKRTAPRSERLDLGAAADQSEDTQMAIPLSQRLQALRGDDGIPFASVDPSAKPQMQPLKKPAPRPIRDDSTTVDVGDADELFDDADALAAQILRQSSALPAIDNTDDATVIRDSQPLPGVDDTRAETNLHKPLSQRNVRVGLPVASVDQTTLENVHEAGGADATTQDFETYGKE